MTRLRIQLRQQLSCIRGSRTAMIEKHIFVITSYFDYRLSSIRLRTSFSKGLSSICMVFRLSDRRERIRNYRNGPSCCWCAERSPKCARSQCVAIAIVSLAYEGPSLRQDSPDRIQAIFFHQFHEDLRVASGMAYQKIPAALGTSQYTEELCGELKNI